MAFPKSKRHPSNFEVYNHFYKLRKDMTDLILRDFGYSTAKADRRLERLFGGRPFSELAEHQQTHYVKRAHRYEAFDEWFVSEQRQALLDHLRDLQEYIFTANSIYATVREEYVERRLLQDKAIGKCAVIIQELQYTINTLPVDINRYTQFIDAVYKEIDLIKGWRKSDNRQARHKGFI